MSSTFYSPPRAPSFEAPVVNVACGMVNYSTSICERSHKFVAVVALPLLLPLRSRWLYGAAVRDLGICETREHKCRQSTVSGKLL